MNIRRPRMGQGWVCRYPERATDNAVCRSHAKSADSAPDLDTWPEDSIPLAEGECHGFLPCSNKAKMPRKMSTGGGGHPGMVKSTGMTELTLPKQA